MTTTETKVTTQVYRVYIKAAPEAIWDAITKPEWTRKYGYQGIAEYDLRPGGTFRSLAPPEMQAMGMPEVVVDGEVIEADPPRKLVPTAACTRAPAAGADPQQPQDPARDRPGRLTLGVAEALRRQGLRSVRRPTGSDAFRHLYGGRSEQWIRNG